MKIKSNIIDYFQLLNDFLSQAVTHRDPRQVGLIVFCMRVGILKGHWKPFLNAHSFRNYNVTILFNSDFLGICYVLPLFYPLFRIPDWYRLRETMSLLTSTSFNWRRPSSCTLNKGNWIYKHSGEGLNIILFPSVRYYN